MIPCDCSQRDFLNSCLLCSASTHLYSAFCVCDPSSPPAAPVFNHFPAYQFIQQPPSSQQGHPDSVILCLLLLKSLFYLERLPLTQLPIATHPYARVLLSPLRNSAYASNILFHGINFRHHSGTTSIINLLQTKDFLADFLEPIWRRNEDVTLTRRHTWRDWYLWTHLLLIFVTLLNASCQILLFQ